MRRHELCDGLAVGLGKLLGELARRRNCFDPPGVVMRGAQFFALEEVSFAENADEAVIWVDDGQSTDIMVGEKLECIGNARLGLDGHDIAYHYVFGFHRYLLIAPLIASEMPHGQKTDK
jgi:hypothetical protein